MKHQNKLPNSIRKFIRTEKNKIKKQFLSAEQRKLAVTKLYERFTINPRPNKKTKIKKVEK